MAYVYQHIRLDTNKIFYIGIGSDEGGNYYRAKRKSGRSKFWNNIINKTDYRIEIISDNISWEEAKELEKITILKIGRDNLCNLTDGGDGVIGWMPEKSTRERWSEQRRGKTYWAGKKHSEETKIKISDSRMGKSPANKGIPLTNEQRKKISESKKGKPSNQRKRVLCIETNQIFNSCEEAAEVLKINRTSISRNASGKRKSANGLHFKYV